MRNEITVAWGDCDGAGIVYYPRFFHYFDICTWSIFCEVGLNELAMKERYNFVVYPAAEVSAQFHIPCKFRDVLRIESFVTEWRKRFFRIEHTFYKEGKVALVGRELRFMGEPDPADPERMRAAVIPREVIDQIPKRDNRAASPGA